MTPLARAGGWLRRFDVPTAAKHYGPWLALAALPLALNIVLWRGVVQPQAQELRAWRDLKLFAALQPRLVANLGESHRAVMAWQRTVFSITDPSAVMQTVRRLADQFHVQVGEMTTKGAMQGAMKTEPMAASYSTMPLELQASGSLSKLARWMSAVEQQAGLQLDSWTITGATEPGQPHHLAVKLTAILRGAS